MLLGIYPGRFYQNKRSLFTRGSLFNLFNVYLSLLELGELKNSSPPQPSLPPTLYPSTYNILHKLQFPFLNQKKKELIRLKALFLLFSIIFNKHLGERFITIIILYFLSVVNFWLLLFSFYILFISTLF